MLPHFHSADRNTPAPIEPVPTVFPKIVGVDLAAVFVGNRVGGDFYDSIRASPERVLIGLLDVAGRRDENRHILTAAQQMFRTLGAQLFAPADINESDAMTQLCLRLNRGLLEICCGPHSCAAFIACYHEKFGTLCYTNAGHTPALLRDSTGVSELPSTGLPLGLFSHATCDAPTTVLEKCASLLLVSRGVVESEGRTNGSSEDFGLDRVKQIFQAAPSTSAQSLCTTVLNSIAEFTRHAPAPDDRTALALLRTA